LKCLKLINFIIRSKLQVYVFLGRTQNSGKRNYCQITWFTVLLKNKKTDRKITINGFINRLMCFYFRSKTCLKWPVGITHLTQSILLPTFLSLSHILALALFPNIVHLSVRSYRWQFCLLWNLLFRIMESSSWCNVYEMTWGLLCRNFYSVKSLNG
jgi:hypothetical protein